MRSSYSSLSQDFVMVLFLPPDFKYF